MTIDILIWRSLSISDIAIMAGKGLGKRDQDGWEGITDKESLTESRGDLVTQIVDFATRDWIRGGSLTLQVFCVVVEDLKHRGAGGLSCVRSWS